MKKISKLAGIVAAAALLCGISGCDNTETITFTSASIEMVGDPVKTDKAVVFQWKDSVANKDIRITRQTPNGEEVTISNNRYGWIKNGFVDRVSYENQLEAGVEYTYRFYNISNVSSARATEYTLEKKYSCVERKVTFDSIAPAGTKLAPITEDQVKIVKSEVNGKNYVSVYVNEKEANAWITIEDKTTGDKVSENKSRKGEDGYELKNIQYNPTHNYEIYVGKWWNDNYYNNLGTGIKFDIAATAVDGNNASPAISSFYIAGETVYVAWSGEKDSKYEVSFEAFDNKGKLVTLKKSTVDASAIKHDDFYNYVFTGKASDFITFDATTNKTSVKIAKAYLKKTAKDGTVSEAQKQTSIYPSYTTYTRLNRQQKWVDDRYWDNDRGEWIYGYYITVIDDLSVENDYALNEETGDYDYFMNVKLSGTNLPATAKLYYKSHWEDLYTEFKDGLKKNGSDLTAKVSFEQSGSYDFKAVVTVDNAKWYNWEEGKTEEVATKYNQHIDY